MASGRAHHGLTILIALGSSGGMYLAGAPKDQIIALTAGVLAGALITPDLDVQGPTRAHTIARRSGGCLFGWLWRLLWMPYSYIIPRHRHPLSHWPVIGTLTRLLYLGLLAWAVLSVAGLPLPLIWWLPWAAGGLILADIGHWFLDRSYSFRSKSR
jgi:uncharacterized metal-binding protein